MQHLDPFSRPSSPLPLFSTPQLHLHTTLQHHLTNSTTRKLNTNKQTPNTEFAATLHKILSSSPADNPSSDRALRDSLLTDLAKHIEKLHACQQTYVPGLSGDPEIDGLATGLWNVCTRLGREWKAGVGWEEDVGGGGLGNGKEGGGKQEQTRGEGRGGEGQSGCQEGREGKGGKAMGGLGRLYLYGRVLAFHLLGVARPRENGRVGVVVRLMRLGLKVVRDCVGESRLFAPWVLGRADG
jgi:hypothetical protein